MKTTQLGKHLGLFAWLGLFGLWLEPIEAQVQVVNIVPATNSAETARDSEPNIAVDPANPSVIAASAFTPDPNGTLTGVLYFSIDGGQTWNLTPAFVPGSAQLGCVTTYCDISLRFAGSSDRLYVGYLNVDASGSTNLQVGDVTNIGTNTRAFTPLETRNGASGKYADQPWVQATTVLEFAGAGNDHTYVSNNNTELTTHTASVDLSLNPNPPPPSGFNADVVEANATCGQDGPSVRSAAHLGGTVYVAFFRWTAGACNSGGLTTADIVVVRDDNWGTGPNAFQALNGTAGQTVATNVNIAFLSPLGSQRTGSQLAIAVDPNDNRTVYIAWGDGNSGANYTLHVRHSTTSGQSWDNADLRTISTATNPGLAINSRSKVAFLYQQLGNPGTGNRWRTHLERTSNTFTNVQDLLLADVPDQAGSYTGANPIGDYANVIAIGKDFYGIFSAFNHADNADFPNGVTYLRYANFTAHQLYADLAQSISVNDSIDPFFFHVTELSADQDYYVRDWTNSPSSRDLGQEPSTNPTYWYSSDVWNRATNSPGTQNASGWYPTDNMQAGAGTKGDNYAFARVDRNATGSSAQVTLHFVVSPFGAGSNFQDAGTDPDPVLSFGNTDSEQTMSTGYHWHQDPTSSTHACIAVQISTPGDPYIPPGLVGISPAWPSGEAIVLDNNKAQRNLDVSNNLADTTGIDLALIHNAGIFPHDIVLHFDTPDPELLAGAQVFVVGGETQEFRAGGTMALANVQPGENRWLGLRLRVPKGDPIPIHFLQLEQGRGANGFTILARPVALPDAIRDNLANHSQAFARLAAAFKVGSAADEAKAADKLLASPTITSAEYLAFLKGHLHNMTSVLSLLIGKGAGDDIFQTRKSLELLGTAVKASDINESASEHAILLHEIDGFATMLQKAEGDPSDIVQMVRWQLELYQSRAKLASLQCSHDVIGESSEFLGDWAAKKAHADSYGHLLGELSRCFKRTAEALEKGHEDLEKSADAVEDAVEHKHSLPNIEKVHRNFLLKLDQVSR